MAEWDKWLTTGYKGGRRRLTITVFWHVLFLCLTAGPWPCTVFGSKSHCQELGSVLCSLLSSEKQYGTHKLNLQLSMWLLGEAGHPLAFQQWRRKRSLLIRSWLEQTWEIVKCNVKFSFPGRQTPMLCYAPQHFIRRHMVLFSGCIRHTRLQYKPSSIKSEKVQTWKWWGWMDGSNMDFHPED